MVRGIVDDVGLYDTVPPGAKGELWLEVSPRSFNVRVREGTSLTQLMVFAPREGGASGRVRPWLRPCHLLSEGGASPQLEHGWVSARSRLDLG